ncbi:MAG TPA: hypothetical protein VFZ97_19700 [Acidimicrobiales bacterium]
MDKATSVPRHSRDAIDWLASYQPLEIDPARWDDVRGFVWDCVQRLGWDSDSAAAWRALRELARISSWAVGEGLPLDIEVVLDPDTVERFIAVGLAGNPSRATYRGVLRRIGPRLTRRAPWQPRPAAAARRQVALPYTADGLKMLRADALVQPTAGRVRAARALLALGAGAGLDGRWVARVTAAHVLRAGDAVLVSVGAPSARRVPVLATWEGEILDLAATADGGFLVGGYSSSKNRAGALAASLVVPNGHPRFSAPRLRSTWLVTHLALGTRLPELARAAGLQGVTVLSDLLANVPALDEAKAATMLRGLR